MINCKRCSKEYDEALGVCPYCGDIFQEEKRKNIQTELITNNNMKKLHKITKSFVVILVFALIVISATVSLYYVLENKKTYIDSPTNVYNDGFSCCDNEGGSFFSVNGKGIYYRDNEGNISTLINTDKHCRHLLFYKDKLYFNMYIDSDKGFYQIVEYEVKKLISKVILAAQSYDEFSENYGAYRTVGATDDNIYLIGNEKSNIGYGLYCVNASGDKERLFNCEYNALYFDQSLIYTLQDKIYIYSLDDGTNKLVLSYNDNHIHIVPIFVKDNYLYYYYDNYMSQGIFLERVNVMSGKRVEDEYIFIQNNIANIAFAAVEDNLYFFECNDDSTIEVFKTSMAFSKGKKPQKLYSIDCLFSTYELLSACVLSPENRYIILSKQLYVVGQTEGAIVYDTFENKTIDIDEFVHGSKKQNSVEINKQFYHESNDSEAEANGENISRESFLLSDNADKYLFSDESNSECSRITDGAMLLSNSEQALIEKALDSVSVLFKFDIAIVTASKLNGKSPRDYAEEFYKENNFGYGSNKHGMLLLVSMENRDWHITTAGIGNTIFDNDRIEEISNAFLSDLSLGNYYQAFGKFIDITKQVYSEHNINDENVMPH